MPKCIQLYVTLDRHFWFNSVKNGDNVWEKQTNNLDKRYQVIVTFLGDTYVYIVYDIHRIYVRSPTTVRTNEGNKQGLKFRTRYVDFQIVIQVLRESCRYPRRLSVVEPCHPIHNTYPEGSIAVPSMTSAFTASLSGLYRSGERDAVVSVTTRLKDSNSHTSLAGLHSFEMVESAAVDV